MAGSSYIKLTKVLDHPKKGSIVIQNIDDNERFKLCLVRYLHPANRITKMTKSLQNIFDFTGIQFPVKIRDIPKIKKMNCIVIIVSGYEYKGKYPVYLLKNWCEEKHVDLLLIGEEDKRHYALTKDFNKFTYIYVWLYIPS